MIYTTSRNVEKLIAPRRTSNFFYDSSKTQKIILVLKNTLKLLCPGKDDLTILALNKEIFGKIQKSVLGRWLVLKNLSKQKRI